MKPISDIRKEYSKFSLDSTTVDKNPIAQFKKWFEEALNSAVPEPNAFTLSTVSTEGKPSARIVLLKGIESEKFIFYTNYQSRKGKELDTNPVCALTFFWPELERQVRVEGSVARSSWESSEKYFQSRPRGSQIGAHASPQSTLIDNRELLQERMAQMEKKFEKSEVIPKPEHWGGFEIDPQKIEFWQGRLSRLHDRIVYNKIEGKWHIYRLAP